MIHRQKGFIDIVIIVVVAVLIVGAVGYIAYRRGSTASTATPSSSTAAGSAAKTTSTGSSVQAASNIKSFYDAYFLLLKPSFSGQASAGSSQQQINSLIEKYVGQPLANKLEKPTAGSDSVLCVSSEPQGITYGAAHINGSVTDEQVTTSSASGQAVATVELRNSDLLIISIACPQ